jgi:hypothetical protein
MTVTEIIEENQERLRLMNPQAFKTEEEHGNIRLTYKHGGIYATNGGLIKLWTQDSSLSFYHTATFITTERSKPFRLTSEDIIELGNSTSSALMRIKKRFYAYGYEDYYNAN